MLPLSEAFLLADNYDNATGAPGRDGLPDFSGEIISGILDIANTPYSAWLSEGKEDALRDLTVKEVLLALDTLCHRSPYDREGGVRKPGAKLLVLASSYMTAYGQFDVDTLFRSLGCSVPVISPLEAMMDEVFRGAGKVKVGVLSRREDLSSGIYSSVFSERCRRHARQGSSCTVLARRDSSGFLTAFFDDYIASGAVEALDYLIVDGYGYDVPSLYAVVDSLTSVMNPESLKYSKFISPDLKILTPEESILRSCYSKMRQMSIFSYRISYPEARGYLTAGESLLIPFSLRYVPESLSSVIRTVYPQTFSFYVQD